MKTENIKMTKTNMVFFHKNCLDGTTSASNALLNLGSEKTFKYAINHSQMTVEKINKKEKILKDIENIYILDITLDKDVISRIYEINPNISIVIIDHHISVSDKKELYDELFKDFKFKFYLNTKYSACALSYLYFIQDVDLDNLSDIREDKFVNQLPIFIQYIEDKDLWNNKFSPVSDKFCFGMKNTIGKDNVDEFVETFKYVNSENSSEKEEINNFVEKLVKEEGKIFDFYFDKVEKLSSEYESINFLNENGEVVSDINAIMINLPVSEYASYSGNFILSKNKDVDVVLIYQIASSDKIYFGVRSKDNFSSVYFSKLYGGGGHDCASGFKLNSIKELYDFINLLKK